MCTSAVMNKSFPIPRHLVQRCFNMESTVNACAGNKSQSAHPSQLRTQKRNALLHCKMRHRPCFWQLTGMFIKRAFLFGIFDSSSLNWTCCRCIQSNCTVFSDRSHAYSSLAFLSISFATQRNGATRKLESAITWLWKWPR